MQKVKGWQRWVLLIGTIFLLVSLAGCQAAPSNNSANTPSPSTSVLEGGTSAPPSPLDQSASPTGGSKALVNQGQSYSTRDEVAAYIHQFHALPPNYITKTEAQKLGWDNAQGNLWQVTDHKSIGGDRFGNREGLLPPAAGRQYYECDIGYYGGYRGAERIIYSNDGLIFYTNDHYNTFKQLY